MSNSYILAIDPKLFEEKTEERLGPEQTNYIDRLKTYDIEQMPTLEPFEVVREIERGYQFNDYDFAKDPAFKDNELEELLGNLAPENNVAVLVKEKEELDKQLAANEISQEHYNTKVSTLDAQIKRRAELKEVSDKKRQYVETKLNELGIPDTKAINFLLSLALQGNQNILHSALSALGGSIMNKTGKPIGLPQGEQQTLHFTVKSKDEFILEGILPYNSMSGNDKTSAKATFTHKVTAEGKNQYRLVLDKAVLELTKDDEHNLELVKLFANQACIKKIKGEYVYRHEDQALAIILAEHLDIAKSLITQDIIELLIKKQLAFTLNGDSLSELELQIISRITNEQGNEVVKKFAKESIKKLQESQALENYHLAALNIAIEDPAIAKDLLTSNQIEFFITKQLIEQSYGRELEYPEQQIISLINADKVTEVCKKLASDCISKLQKGEPIENYHLTALNIALENPAIAKDLLTLSQIQFFITKQLTEQSYGRELNKVEQQILCLITSEQRAEVLQKIVIDGFYNYYTGNSAQDYHLEALTLVMDEQKNAVTSLLVRAKAKAKLEIGNESKKEDLEFATEFLYINYVKQGLTRYLADNPIQALHVGAINLLKDRRDDLLKSLLNHDMLSKFMVKRLANQANAIEPTAFEQEVLSAIPAEVLDLHEKLQSPKTQVPADLSEAEKKLLRRLMCEQVFAGGKLSENSLELAILSEKPNPDLPSVLELYYAYTSDSSSVYQRSINDIILDYIELDDTEKRSKLIRKLRFLDWLDNNELLPPTEQALLVQRIFGTHLSSEIKEKLTQFQQRYAELYEDLIKTLSQGENTEDYESKQNEILKLAKSFGLDNTSLMLPLSKEMGELEQGIEQIIQIVNRLSAKPQADEIVNANIRLRQLGHAALDEQGICKEGYKDLARQITLKDVAKQKNLFYNPDPAFYSEIYHRFTANAFKQAEAIQTELKHDAADDALVSLLTYQSGIIGMSAIDYSLQFTDKSGEIALISTDQDIHAGKVLAYYDQQGHLVVEAKRGMNFSKSIPVLDEKGKPIKNLYNYEVVARGFLYTSVKIQKIEADNNRQFAVVDLQKNFLINAPLADFDILPSANIIAVKERRNIACNFLESYRAKILRLLSNNDPTWFSRQRGMVENLENLVERDKKLEKHTLYQKVNQSIRDFYASTPHDYTKLIIDLYSFAQQNLQTSRDSQERQKYQELLAFVTDLYMDTVQYDLFNYAKVTDASFWLHQAEQLARQKGFGDERLAVAIAKTQGQLKNKGIRSAVLANLQLTPTEFYQNLAQNKDIFSLSNEQLSKQIHQFTQDFSQVINHTSAYQAAEKLMVLKDSILASAEKSTPANPELASAINGFALYFELVQQRQQLNSIGFQYTAQTIETVATSVKKIADYLKTNDKLPVSLRYSFESMANDLESTLEEDLVNSYNQIVLNKGINEPEATLQLKINSLLAKDFTGSHWQYKLTAQKDFINIALATQKFVSDINLPTQKTAVVVLPEFSINPLLNAIKYLQHYTQERSLPTAVKETATKFDYYLQAKNAELNHAAVELTTKANEHFSKAHDGETVKLFSHEILPLLQVMSYALAQHPGKNISWFRIFNTQRQEYKRLLKSRDGLLKTVERHLQKALAHDETHVPDDARALVHVLQNDDFGPRLLKQMADKPAYLTKACLWVANESYNQPTLALRFLGELLTDPDTRSYLLKQGALNKGITALRHTAVYNDPIAALVREALNTKDAAHLAQFKIQPGEQLLRRLLNIPAVAAKISGEDWVELAKRDSSNLAILLQNKRYLSKLSGSDIAQLTIISEAMRATVKQSDMLTRKLLGTSTSEGIFELYMTQPAYLNELLKNIGAKEQTQFWQTQPFLQELKGYVKDTSNNIVTELAELAQNDTQVAATLIKGLENKSFVQRLLEQVDTETLTVLAQNNIKVLNKLLDYSGKFAQVLDSNTANPMAFLPKHVLENIAAKENMAVVNKLFSSPAFIKKLSAEMTVGMFHRLSDHFNTVINSNAVLRGIMAECFNSLEMEFLTADKIQATFKANGKEYVFKSELLNHLFTDNLEQAKVFYEKYPELEKYRSNSQEKSNDKGREFEDQNQMRIVKA